MTAGPESPEWRIETRPVAYPQAVATMEARVAAIRQGTAPELLWLLEHPPLYTAGTSARPADLRDPAGLPVHVTGRGGQYTYHGPGQRIVYAMLDLQRRQTGLRCFVHHLEAWAIMALARLGVRGERRDGRIGVWVVRPDGREDKIAAIGVRVRRQVSFHGLSINVAPDLNHYRGIVPCGLDPARYGTTSLADLGHATDMARLDAALRASFSESRSGGPVSGLT